MKSDDLARADSELLHTRNQRRAFEAGARTVSGPARRPFVSLEMGARDWDTPVSGVIKDAVVLLSPYPRQIYNSAVTRPSRGAEVFPVVFGLIFMAFGLAFASAFSSVLRAKSMGMAGWEY